MATLADLMHQELKAVYGEGSLSDLLNKFETDQSVPTLWSPEWMVHVTAEGFSTGSVTDRTLAYFQDFSLNPRIFLNGSPVLLNGDRISLEG